MTAAAHVHDRRPAGPAAVFDRDPVGDQIPAPHLRKRLPGPLQRKYLQYDVEQMTMLLQRRGFTVVNLGITKRGREAALSVMGGRYRERFGIATVWLRHNGQVEWDATTGSYRLPGDLDRVQVASMIAGTLR